MTENFELTSGKNRALVCYLNHIDGEAFYETVAAVFAAQNITIDEASANNVFHADEPQPALNIALQWADTSRNLKVGGNFIDVCVGVYFYTAPQPPEPAPEPDPDDAGKWREYMSAYQSINQDEEPEPEPPSITSLVCDALRDTFGGVYGASAFVIPNTVTEFTLEVE